MAIRRKIGVRTGIRRRVPASVAKQEMLKANLKRFQEVATRIPKVTSEPTPKPPASPPPAKARAAPVGEIIPPERVDLEAFSPGARMAEANRHVRRSVREASLIIRDSEVFFLGAKQSVTETAGPGTEQAADTVRQAERSVAEALEFVLGPAFMEPGPSRKPPVPPAVKETVPGAPPQQTVLATTVGSSS
jgi:hypothetical protein